MPGKRYAVAQGKISNSQFLPLLNAIEKAQGASYSRFDGSLEIHIRLGGKKKEDRGFKTTLTLPHGRGKKQNVVVLDEKAIEEISYKKQAPADIYLASFQLMPQVAKIAKILGPQGKMPNPRSGTVIDNPAERLKELSTGNLVEVKSDPSGIIHSTIGRVSWEAVKIKENAESILRAVPKAKIKSITIAATMGPGVRVAL